MNTGTRTRLRSGLHTAAHILLLAIGWLLFGWLWWRVIGRPWDSQVLRLLVLAAALLFPLVTGIWIVHNKGIYRRLGPRRAVLTALVHYSTDFNGRKIDADWHVLQAARRVLVACDGPVKRFRPERLPPAPNSTLTTPLPEPMVLA